MGRTGGHDPVAQEDGQPGAGPRLWSASKSSLLARPAVLTRSFPQPHDGAETKSPHATVAGSDSAPYGIGRAAGAAKKEGSAAETGLAAGMRVWAGADRAGRLAKHGSDGSVAGWGASAGQGAVVQMRSEKGKTRARHVQSLSPGQALALSPAHGRAAVVPAQEGIGGGGREAAGEQISCPYCGRDFQYTPHQQRKAVCIRHALHCAMNPDRKESAKPKRVSPLVGDKEERPRRRAADRGSAGGGGGWTETTDGVWSARGVGGGEPSAARTDGDDTKGGIGGHIRKRKPAQEDLTAATLAGKRPALAVARSSSLRSGAALRTVFKEARGAEKETFGKAFLRRKYVSRNLLFVRARRKEDARGKEEDAEVGEVEDAAVAEVGLGGGVEELEGEEEEEEEQEEEEGKKVEGEEGEEEEVEEEEAEVGVEEEEDDEEDDDDDDDTADEDWPIEALEAQAGKRYREVEVILGRLAVDSWPSDLVHTVVRELVALSDRFVACCSKYGRPADQGHSKGERTGKAVAGGAGEEQEQMTIAKMMERVDSGYYMSDKSTCMAKVERDFNAIIYGSICEYPASHEINRAARVLYNDWQEAFKERREMVVCRRCCGDEIYHDNRVLVCDTCCTGIHDKCLAVPRDEQGQHPLRGDSMWFCSRDCSDEFARISSRFKCPPFAAAQAYLAREEVVLAPLMPQGQMWPALVVRPVTDEQKQEALRQPECVLLAFHTGEAPGRWLCKWKPTSVCSPDTRAAPEELLQAAPLLVPDKARRKSFIRSLTMARRSDEIQESRPKLARRKLVGRKDADDGRVGAFAGVAGGFGYKDCPICHLVRG